MAPRRTGRTGHGVLRTKLCMALQAQFLVQNYTPRISDVDLAMQSPSNELIIFFFYTSNIYIINVLYFVSLQFIECNISHFKKFGVFLVGLSLNSKS